MIVEINCGLFWVTIEETRAPSWSWQFTRQRLVPLQSVSVEACLVETTSEVKITQKYRNPNSFPVEAIYVFPLDNKAAICEFEAEIEGKKVIGVAKSKEVASQEYNAAVRRGDGAYLLEQAKADVFKAKVGNIPPGVEVSIIIKYVAEMRNELENVSFVLPTDVAPRYTPVYYSPKDQPIPGGNVNDHYAPLSLSITCVSTSGFNAITSPSHNITTSINGQMASVGLAHGLAGLDKDFVLHVAYSSPHEPKVVLEDDGKGSYAAMITLFPHLEFAEAKTELVFVVDRSGSMQSKVGELREALQLFMRSLPSDCFFNIIGFGSSYQKLTPESRRYDDDTLRVASKHIASLGADLGGTELYQPLQHVFGQPLIPGYSRQVFVLTDGQVSNTEQVIDLVRKNNKRARVFTLGIGNSVSHHLVEGMAKAGLGTSFFVLQNERIEKKVLKQLKDATQPALNDVKVNWGMATSAPASEPVGSKVLSLLNYVSPAAKEKPVEIQQAPHFVPPIHSDEHFRIYALFTTPKLPPTITIEAASPDGLLRVELPVDSEKVIKGNLLHTLAARSLIRDLEEGSSYLHAKGSPSQAVVRDEIIRLGTKYSLASQHTSFIAIEERSLHDSAHAWQWQYTPVPTPQPVFSVHSSAPQARQKSSAFGYSAFAAPAPSSAPSFTFSSSSAPSSSSRSRSAVPPPAPSGGGFTFGAAPPPAPPGATFSFGSAPPPPPYADLSSIDHEFARESASQSAYPSKAMAAESFAGFSFSQEKEEDEADDLRMEKMKKKKSASKESKTFTFGSSSAPAPAAAAPSKGGDPRSTLNQLLSYQGAQGFFEPSPALFSALGVSLSSSTSSSSSLLGRLGDQQARERAWSTALVLAFLKARLAELEDEWEMVAAKAKRWLSSLVGAGEVNGLLAEAQQCL